MYVGSCLPGLLNALRGVDANFSDAYARVTLRHVDVLHALVVVWRLRPYQAHLHMQASLSLPDVGCMQLTLSIGKPVRASTARKDGLAQHLRELALQS